jgi:hypothetical protein
MAAHIAACRPDGKPHLQSAHGGDALCISLPASLKGKP